MQKSTPNYKKIFTDILDYKYPHKKKECANILHKESLLAIDIIRLNEKIFGVKQNENSAQNQRHKSYDKSTIFQILDYQKKNALNNSQLAIHFNLSRNTIQKWKKQNLSS